MKNLHTKYLMIGFVVSFAAACSSPQKHDSPPAPIPSPAPVNNSLKTSEDASESMEMKCKRDADERTLIIVPKDLGCELHYQKFGKSQVKASSASGQKHCENIRSQMRKNLESAGFKCQ